MPRKTDKRERLVEAAKTLMHQKGYNQTTLADIAEMAEVPLGNVYYYFKTKEAIAETVINNLHNELKARLAAFEQNDTPLERLKAFIAYESTQAESYARFGETNGTLCQELAKVKTSDLLPSLSGSLLNELIVWVELQYQTMGATDNARTLALQLVANLQGNALLASTANNAELYVRLNNVLLSTVSAKVKANAALETA